MKNWIARWVASVLALLVVSQVVPGIHLTTPVAAVIAVVVLGLVNSFIRPIIMFFAWPVNCLTFGLFGFGLNVLLFYIVGQKFIPGFEVKDLMAALIGSVAMGILSGLFNFILKDRGDKDEK